MMSLFPEFDSLFYPESYRRSLVPSGRRHRGHRYHSGFGNDDFWPITPLSISVPLYSPTNTALSRFLTDEFRQMQELERQMMDVQTQAEGNAVNFSCNIAGYLPEELKVELEGNELVIQGEHKQEGEGQSIHRTMMRRLKLPEGVQKESIQCNIDDKGKLLVQAQREGVEQQQRISIPIGFKQVEQGARPAKADSEER